MHTVRTHLRSHFGSSHFGSRSLSILVCASMLMNRGSSLALFLVLFGSAPSQVRAAGIGQGENNPENEFDTGNRLVGSCVPVPFGAVPCVSCASPGARKPSLGKGGLVRVFVTSWPHTVDIATIVKFDQKAFLSKEGFGCCDAGRTACCVGGWACPLVRGFALHALSLLGRCCVGLLLAVLRLSGFSSTRALLCRAMLDLPSGL